MPYYFEDQTEYLVAVTPPLTMVAGKAPQVVFSFHLDTMALDLDDPEHWVNFEVVVMRPVGSQHSELDNWTKQRPGDFFYG